MEIDKFAIKTAEVDEMRLGGENFSACSACIFQSVNRMDSKICTCDNRIYVGSGEVPNGRILESQRLRSYI